MTEPYMKRLFYCLVLGFFVVPAIAQDFAFSKDSLHSLLNGPDQAISSHRILLYTNLLTQYLPNDPVFDSLKNRLIEEVENSRDREMMAMAYDQIAKIYLSYGGGRNFYEQGKPYADKCMQIAVENRLDAYKASSCFRYARYWLEHSRVQKALDYNNQSISIASAIRSDSLLALAYGYISETWDQMANRLSEFQALLNERDFAEKSGVHYLILHSYTDLGKFYEDGKDPEKAKDFFTLSLKRSREWGDGYSLFNSLRALGRIHFAEKNESLGTSFYNKAITLSDSLKIQSMKIQIYLDLLNYYFNNGDPKKGFTYLNEHPELMDLIEKYGITYQLNKLYAVLKSNEQNYDSALYYLKVAMPLELAQNGNFNEKYNFIIQLANVYQNLQRFEDQKNTLLLANRLADSADDLYFRRDVAQQLDSVFVAVHDYKNAEHYLSLFNLYRDSLESLAKQKDLLNIEIGNANKRLLQEKEAELTATRKRNNLEYLGITAAIATVFIILVLFGVFKISPAVIRALGFFAFIFLFEFIVLLLDEQIHEFTHGEPWKILGVKIIIISLLLPFHHWLEEKMHHYLTHKVPKIRNRSLEKLRQTDERN
jgi:hypothetical protein